LYKQTTFLHIIKYLFSVVLPVPVQFQFPSQNPPAKKKFTPCEFHLLRRMLAAIRTARPIVALRTAVNRSVLHTHTWYCGAMHSQLRNVGGRCALRLLQWDTRRCERCAMSTCAAPSTCCSGIVGEIGLKCQFKCALNVLAAS